MAETERMEMIDAIAKRRAEEEQGSSTTDDRADTQRHRDGGGDQGHQDRDILERANRLLAETSDSRSRVDAADALQMRQPLRAAEEVDAEEHRKEILTERTRDLTNAIYEVNYARVESSMEALLESAAVDVGVVKAAVKRELVLENFAEAYPEIIESADLSRIADTYYDRAIAAGRTERQALHEAGERTRAQVRDMREAINAVDESAESSRDVQHERDDVHSVIAEMAAQRPAR